MRFWQMLFRPRTWGGPAIVKLDNPPIPTEYRPLPAEPVPPMPVDVPVVREPVGILVPPQFRDGRNWF